MPDDLFKAQLGTSHHRGYAVQSIEATVERLVEQLGAGPFFLVENVPLENVLSRGERAELAHNSAFGHCGGAPIELLQLVRAAPERVKARWSGPRPGIHHVAYALPRPEAEDLRRSLDERGMPGT
jgi:methylmalonyl-CoA/ethylmalonyl-CoA epimerase